MKRLFMTFAAMLLMSVSAFAQSNEPLKGDVNEDGVVDVADITAIIDIMKDADGVAPKNNYYLGETNALEISTMNNYSATPITSIHANYATGDTVTTFVFPTSWGTPTFIDSGGNNMTNAWLLNNDVVVPSGYRSCWSQVDNPAGETFTLTWK